MMGDQRLITISGVAGAGKDTVVGMAMPRLLMFGIGWAPSVTTRDPRTSDGPGTMIFLSRDEFLTELASGGMMEHTTVTGNLYGTPVGALGAGPHGGIKIITVDGLRSIRAWMVGAGMDPSGHLMSVYITVPVGDAHSRLARRGWTPEVIAERDSFNLQGYDHSGVPDDEGHIWSLMVDNPDGGLDDAVQTMVRAVRDFLR